MGGGQSDEESQKSSKRASIVDESTSHPERNTDHNLDNLIEVSQSPTQTVFLELPLIY